jgi:cell fate regulator YaaT (PSP1 superfamily)
MTIAGILSGRSGSLLYCDGGPSPLSVGDHIIVDTEHGRLLGRVVSLHENPPAGSCPERASIVRTATDADMVTAAANRELALSARRFCRECIGKRGLDMKLADVEVSFDAGKIVFYFTAPARIDFRELLKDLVREYRARIELRQIGVRHETQMLGAVGNCGMVCCCRRFLRKFAPVTIRMAKEQNLFLNPAKISGICGRLLCCLSYEQENYDAFHRECPRLGKKYTTRRGVVKVLRANMFRNSVFALCEDGEEKEFGLEEWRAMEAQRPEQACVSRPERAEPPPGDAGDFPVVSVSPDSLDDPEAFGEEPLFAEDGEDSPPPDPASPPLPDENAGTPAKKRRSKRRSGRKYPGNETNA